MYLLENIAWIIFSYFNIGNRYTHISTMGIVLRNVLTIWLCFIPGINDIYIFGHIDSNQSLQVHGVQLPTFFGDDLGKFGLKIDLK